MEYPNVPEIRKRLEMLKVPSSFVEEAYKVCDEAEKHEPAVTDIQLIAKLQFIEKVLNG